MVPLLSRVRLYGSGEYVCRVFYKELSQPEFRNGASAFFSYMIQTVGPYKQTGLAQIGPIHPPPSFSCQQAILRPYRFYNVRKKCGCPIKIVHLIIVAQVEFNNFNKNSETNIKVAKL